MKFLFIFGAFIFSFATALAAVETVPSMDLNLYQGTWYEIASIPKFFQKKCVKNSQANYKIENDSANIIVTNTCTLANGELKIASGRARTATTNTNSKLQVTFAKIFTWIFSFGGDYWVIGLDSDYKWAVVGSPKADYAWILSRTPALAEADLIKTHEILKLNGYDTCQLLTTVQDTGFEQRTPLCKIQALQPL